MTIQTTLPESNQFPPDTPASIESAPNADRIQLPLVKDPERLAARLKEIPQNQEFI